jgi:organic hydroperoxide reductase OsmC/OhrA
MKISATVKNSAGRHEATVQTNDQKQSIAVPPKATGPGSSANGGELLFLALATCYCNDIYREAARHGIEVEGVEVEVEGDFGGVGEPDDNVTYRARVRAHATEAAIRELMAHTDTVAEIQNTLRVGPGVTLSGIEAIVVD